MDPATPALSARLVAGHEGFAGEAELLGLDLSAERSKARRGAVTMAAHALWVVGATRLTAEALLLGPWPPALGDWLSRRVRRVYAAGPGDARDTPGRVVAVDAPLDALPFRAADLDACVLYAASGPLARPKALRAQLRACATMLRDLGPLVVVAKPSALGAGTPDELEQRLLDAGPWSIVTPVDDALPAGADAVQVVLRRRRRRLPMPPRPPAQSIAAVTAPPPDAVLAMATLLVDPITVVDGGVRGGFHERWTQLRPNVRLVGFDFDKEECTRLTRELAGVVDATLVPLALGSEEGTATAHQPGPPAGASLLPPEGTDLGTGHLVGIPGEEHDTRSEVEVVRLDRWLRHAGIDLVDVLKLDIEGGELEALRGAEDALGTVRAIECEVHFNPNSVGTPLYGELDTWLRERGFVLWRMRDLAHYRLKEARGARLPVTVETSFYQGADEQVEPGHHPGLPGQLMWANAHWLHESVFKPPAGDWTDRVRDAVITRALGFHDAAYVCLRHALASSPPADIAEALIATLALEDPV